VPQTPDNAIAAYLADHMAGSLSAAYLARRVRRATTAFISLLIDLTREIETDRPDAGADRGMRRYSGEPAEAGRVLVRGKHLVPEATDRTVHLILADRQTRPERESSI
jgi:hypothetical protein